MNTFKGKKRLKKKKRDYNTWIRYSARFVFWQLKKKKKERKKEKKRKKIH